MKIGALLALASFLSLASVPAVSALQSAPVAGLIATAVAQNAGSTDTTKTTTTKDPGTAATTTTTTTTTVWYTDPVWIGLGAVGVLLVIVVLIAALRGDGHTTVVTR